MSCVQIKLFIEKKFVEEWTEILLDLGACAITIQDDGNQPIFEHDIETLPAWNKVQIIGLYESNIQINTVKKYLYDKLGKDVAFNVETIEEQNWQDKWKENLEPIKFGDNLWICPSWCEIPEPQACNIILDPGIAFGTGSHPTTNLCLQWIAENIKGDEVVIDFGCGSGILGIAAAKIGAKTVYAIDCDKQALLSTRENANRNNINSTQLNVLEPDQLPEQLKADSIVANILFNTLIDLVDILSAHIKSYGKIVLSGILHNQTDEIFRAYSKNFYDLKCSIKEEWVMITGIRK